MEKGYIDIKKSFDAFDRLNRKTISEAVDEKDDTDGVIYDRMINIMSHGNYSIFDPTEMQEENKVYFSKLVRRFLDTYRFNEKLFNELDKGENYGNK